MIASAQGGAASVSEAVLRAVLRPLDRAAALGAILAMSVLVGIVCVEVAMRYLFSSSIFFAAELARLMFVWLIFMALPLALGQGRHVGIAALEAVLPPAAARTLLRAGTVAVAAMFCVVFYKSIETMTFNWDQRLDTMPLSAGLFHLPVPIAAAHAILHLLLQAVAASRAPFAAEGGSDT